MLSVAILAPTPAIMTITLKKTVQQLERQDTLKAFISESNPSMHFPSYMGKNDLFLLKDYSHGGGDCFRTLALIRLLI